MKREYTDPKKEANPNTSAAAIFSNLHRHPQHHFSHPHQAYCSSVNSFHQQPFPFPVVSREVDDESSSGGGGGGGSAPAPTRSQPGPKDQSNNDGASIEVQRRPRGRPPGSKNRPRPPVVITREPDPIMSPSILEVANGADVVEALAKYSSRRNTGLCILSASGAVTNVTIRQPNPNSFSTVTFHGRFDILSLAATFVGPHTQSQIPAGAFNVAVSLSVPQGQIIGGIVAGPLTASGTVYIVAASFSSPSYLRLPLEDEAAMNTATSSGGNEGQSPSAASGENNVNAGGGESGVVAMYSCSLPSDVIWAPTARQPY